MNWQVILSRQAVKDAKRISQANLKPQAEKLVGNLQGFYSRRISIQHRLVYRVIEVDKIVHVLRMWTHYE